MANRITQGGSGDQPKLDNPHELDAYVEWFNRKHKFALAVIKTRTDPETGEKIRFMDLETRNMGRIA